MRLDKKVAIITGGTDGIGVSAARIFANEGARVVIAARNEERGMQIASEFRASGCDVQFVKTDVSKSEEVRRLIDRTVSLFGGVNVLYNNAAVFWPAEDGRITDLTEEIWNKVIAVNLTGTFLCTKYAIPAMISSGGGSIISTSSTGGVLGLGNTAYGASKAGVISLMKNVATHYGVDKIRANTIIPGITETPMVQNLFSDPAVKNQWTEASPLRRFGKPEEIAKLALYLASDESAYATGAEYVMDGGFCAQ